MRTREQVVDEMLVLGAQARRPAAFQALAERWHPRLLRHALRLTGDAEGAREAVQDAWLAIARGLPRLHDPARFGPWALRITTRRCADWIAVRRRARSREGGLALAEGPAASAPEPDDRLETVIDVVRRLEPDHRALVAMYYLEGLSVAEVARALEIPAGTVKSRLHAARERLRAALEVSHDPRQ